MEVVLISPDQREVHSPTKKDIQSAMSYAVEHNGRIGSLWITVRNPHNKSVFRKLWFYFHNESEVILFFESNDNPDWFVSLGDSARVREFSAEDDGGSDWVLNEMFLIALIDAIDVAYRFIEFENIEIDERWTVLPA